MFRFALHVADVCTARSGAVQVIHIPQVDAGARDADTNPVPRRSRFSHSGQRPLGRRCRSGTCTRQVPSGSAGSRSSQENVGRGMRALRNIGKY